MFNDEDDEEATMGAVRYPVMPSLVALQQMRNRLHLAYLGKKLMKWTAMATSKELRRIAIEISDNLKEYGTKIQLGFILLARARYFVPHINTTVLECIPKCATITVKTQPRSVSGVKVRNLYAEDSDVDPYPYLGLNNGGMCIANCKDLWEELVKLMILIVQYKITFVLIEQAHKAANKKQNVLSRCIIPRILITMHYILSELDEREREETFRLKRFKQLKYKGKKADPKEPLEREADVPAPKKPGPEPCPVCAAEEPPPKEPGPEPCPVCAVEEPPPKPAYVPPKAEPKKEIVSAPQVETFTCPLCQMEEAEDSTLRIGVCEQGPPRTAPPKDRLEHLLVHINQLIQLVEQLTAEQQLPCGKKHYIMKCCEGMKFKIEELSSPPPPCEVCMSAKQSVAASVPPTPRPCEVCTTAPLPPVPQPLPKSVPSSPPPCEVCMSAKQSVAASVPPTPRPCDVCTTAPLPPVPQPLPKSVPSSPPPCEVCMSAKQSVVASVPPTPRPCEVCMSAKQSVAASVPPTPRPCGVCTTAPLPPVPQPLPKSVPSSPLPCEVCMSAAQQFEQPVPEPRPLPISPCATLPASVTSSCIPSICGRLVPSEKVSKTAPPCHVPPDASSQRSVLPKGSTISKQKHKLGYFETEYKEIVRVTRSLNPDGTLSEEKQIITVKTERTNPRRKGKKGSDEGYATPCRRSDSDYGGGGGTTTTDNNRSDKDGGVKSKASERQGRDCTGGSHRGTGGDGMGGGGGREMNKPCSEGGVCRSESIHVAAIDYTGSCGGVGKGPHAGAPKTPSVSSCCRSPATVISAPSPPPPTAPSPCAFCGRPPTAPRTLPSTVPAPTPIKTIGLPPPKPCFDGGICKNEPPPADTKIPSCQNSGNSIKSGKPKTDGGARKPGTNETASKASRSSIVIRTCKDCGVCTIRESTNDSGYSTGTSFASGSQSTYDDNCRCDAVCGSRTVVTEYVTSICQSGEDDLDGLRKDCRTIGCGSSLYHTSTFLSGFNPHPPGFSYPPRGPPVTKSTSTTLTFNNNKSTNGCACKARTGTDKNCKMTSTSASETSSVQSRFLSPVAKLKDFYCGTDVSMSMKCVSAATSAQSCWQPETKKMSDKRTFCIPDCSTKGGVSSVNESLVVTTLKRGGEFSLPTLCSSDASKSIKARSLTNTSFSIEIASKSPTSCTDLNKDSNIQYVIKGYPLNALRKMLMPRSISTQCSEVTLVSVVDSSCLCYHAKSATSCPKCSIRLQNNPACYTYVELRDFNLENETCVSCGTLGQLSTPSATTLTESTAIPCSPSPKTSRQSRSNSSGNSLFSGCKSICAAIAKQIAKCTSPLPQEICCPKPGVIKTLKVIPKQIPIPMLDAMTSTKRCDRFDCRPLLAFNNNHTCAKIRKEVCACHSDSHVCKKIDKCSMLQQSKSYSSDLYSRY